MGTRVKIDLNVRVRGNQTFAGLEDADGPLVVGGSVEVYEAETGVVGYGVVTEVDQVTRLVYMLVEWASLREPVVLDFAGFAAAAGGWSAPSLYRLEQVSNAVGVNQRSVSPQLTHTPVEACL